MRVSLLKFTAIWQQWRWLAPAAIVGMAAIAFVGLSLYNYASGCGSRDDAAARVAALSSDLQAAASSGKMAVDALAKNIRRMNELATTYETTGDHRAYCTQLEKLRGDLAL